jgi:RimJ/RimL family protein N-acetyltransferase
VSVPAGATERVTIALACEGVAPWSPDEPVLYRADVRLGDGEATADARTVRFGFRKVAVEGGRLTLNGQPVLLLGYNRHEDSPRTDMAADPELARRDLLRIKQGGANFVRLCHYPHDPSTLDLCDEIGLLVMAEIPLYWWQGHDGPGGESAFGRQYEAAVRQIDRLIDRDGHHPSVIAWSVSNETREDRPEVAEGNRRLVEYVRRRDHHRLAVHVSNHWERHPSFDADDLVCVNGYPYMRGRGWGEAEGEPFDSGEAGEWWRGALETLHARYPDKPILVTEFGHGAIEGAPEGAASESRQAQVVHDQLRNILAAGPWVCGAAVWCWADHAWAEDDWMNRLHVSPFGVVTRNRRAKLALDVLDKSFRASTGRPSLCLRRPDLENLPPLDLPEGYTLRIARDADADAIAAFMGRAFGEMTWTTANVREWLLDDETVKATFVIEHDGAPVATASARLLPEQYPGSGYVHWVGADVGHRGKRLGYLASLATLYEFARLGCKDAVLDTDDFRVPAIKVYLNLGFVPEHRHATHPVRWAKLAPKLEGYLPQ